jgi:hypothetical protein
MMIKAGSFDEARLYPGTVIRERQRRPILGRGADQLRGSLAARRREMQCLSD